jgi:hypothetical protein
MGKLTQDISREPEEWQTISNTPRRNPQPIIQAAQGHMVYGAHMDLAIARGANNIRGPKHREKVAAHVAHEQSIRVRQMRPIQRRRKDEKTVMKRP